ncbi:uncharacterized protein FOMMEDRAFT_170143 [Fomitiporia mediterranea MF3/22]|uniref:uncharacterized protein n=1 Tax=Fomitiporia mediterranea (strain MF3/22) TaxID=694068 RepID=UPI000440939F|nr:uncharacterized protein FOMMEDRAFT_170143 [Fomitiporia mediterranea MF3/22]EJD00125.1 hypothetical protein FOMMEDRAFT_170143 [Fomitiporia mediterranea MF3/22]
MSNIVKEIQLLRQAAYDLQTSRYLTVASFITLTWDILITLEEYISLIWKAKWSSGKILYFAARYPSWLEGAVYLTNTLDFSANPAFCSAALYVDSWSTFVFIIPVQLIVFLRTVAVWDNKRIIIIFLSIAFIATDVTMAICIAFVSKSLVCRFGHNQLIALLLRDGFAYYVVMLVASISNLVIYSALPAKRHGLLASMLQVLRSTMSITGSRILLNVRGVISKRQTTWSQTVGTATIYQLSVQEIPEASTSQVYASSES